MLCAPASIHSLIAAANSCAVAFGICAFAVVASVKIGRISKVQPGQIAERKNPALRLTSRR